MGLYVLAEILKFKDEEYGEIDYNKIGYRIYDSKTMKYVDTSLLSVQKQLLNGVVINGISLGTNGYGIIKTYGKLNNLNQVYELDNIAYNRTLPELLNKRLWTVVLLGEEGLLAVSKGGKTKRVSYASIMTGADRTNFTNFYYDIIDKGYGEFNTRISVRGFTDRVKEFDFKYKIGSAEMLIYILGEIEMGDVSFNKSDKIESLTAKLDMIQEHGYKIDYDGTLLVLDKNIKHIKIPSVCTKIPSKSFFNSRLESIIIGQNVRKIEESAFEDCESLREIDIPGTVRSIGNDCFRNCRNLRKITLGEGIERIGKGTFAHCEELKYVKLPRTMKGNIEVNLIIFSMSSDILVHVPKELKDRTRQIKADNIKIRFY